MLKKCTQYFTLYVIVFLLQLKLAYSQDCSTVASGDITSSPATCPGNGSITVPNLGSSTVYQLSGGGIAGEIQQNSPVFESLNAGTYTLNILCTGLPVKTFTVTVPNKHSALGLTVTGTMVCANAGSISATPTGGYNEGNSATYQYAMWPSSAGAANRPDAALTYGAASTWGSTLSAGDYFVRVKDQCGNIFTQSIKLAPSKPTGQVVLTGTPQITCTGGTFTYSFPGAQLRNNSGASITNFSAPYYKYRVEKVSTAGSSCSGAALESVVIANTDITSASALSSVTLSGVVPGARYRFIITSPCDGTETATCFTPQEVVVLEAKPSRICAPAGGANIRVTANFYSTNGYAIKYPVNYTFTGTGYSHTMTAANYTQLSQMQTNIPESAFPITVTATDNCGLTKSVTRNAPSSGSTPSNLGFGYTLSCVQDNGNVNVLTYPEGNWFGLEYYGGSTNADNTKFELVNSSTSAVVSTVYGLTNKANNEVFFANIPSGQSYFVRVTPPASAGSACPVQNSNVIDVPAAQGLQLTVNPVVEKICNNGLNNIIYNASVNNNTQLIYKLYTGTDATGTLVSESAAPTGLPSGTYYYEVVRPTTSFACPNPAKRSGVITIEAWQVNPGISRSLSVNCQPLGSGPQNTGSALLQFDGYGPFVVEKSENGGAYTVVTTNAISSYTEASLVTGTTYTYRITDQCGKSVSQQVMIKPLSPKLITNKIEPCVNQPYTLSAVDFGDPLTTYKWEKEGVSGTLATTREYTFSPFTAANNGTYKLTISLLNGCVVRETLITLNSTNCGQPFATGSLGDQVWFDNNSNGVQDTGEAGVPGVPVTLEGYVGPAFPSAADLANSSNWGVISTQPTDADGKYLFDGLETGYYRVQFGTVPNYGFTTYNSGTNLAVDSDAGAGGYSGAVLIDAQGTGIAKDNPTIDAGLVPAGSIGDYVWVDENQNGRQDAGEVPRSGVVVNLYVKNASNAWELLETTSTDATGKYLFDGLLAGTYQVEFVLPGGFVFTHSNITGVADDADSDADRSTGKSGEITIDPSLAITDIGRNNMTVDAGIVEGALPVKLSMFEVKKGENVSAILRWETTEEINSNVFEIQRSTDAKSWQVIGQVEARANSSVTNNYRFDDAQPNLGSNYYRLKMIDLDETFAYSIIRQLTGEMNGIQLAVYPNPVSNELSVFNTGNQSMTKIELINKTGKVVLSKNGVDTAAPINVKNLPAGVYLVKITLQNGSVENRRIVIVH